eukprot:CAMPEP_0168257990 /NCGR_PEP_ID=MMETSP0141_2-20121125/6841_1 /TAXON_ID=44445 /ORGANISM="Pseudo-nitzschia australis, Strain 10249 10 AB" /LENGTH=527 /DNA_ID=CAMNT_0008195111 /DNA_START=169 /DNA_END=1752 /DNA_ORIENTATION=+
MNSVGRSLVVFTVGLSLLLLLSSSSSSAASTSATADGVLHIDGGSEFGWDQNSWYVQVDGVMGGKSSGDLEFLALADDASASGNNNDNDNDNDNDNNNEMVLKFTGDISLDGGGFSSVRRRTDLDLSDYTGVVVTLRAADVPASTSTSTSTADIPPPTGLHLQLGDATSYYDFSSALAIPLSNGGDDVWTSVYLPMESFDRGTRFGFVCNNCQFDSSNINNLSVYVLFQEGSFDVRIRSIQAVKEPVVFRSPRLDFASATEITDLLRATVASGGGLYDKSYTELCVAMYWSVLNSLLTATAVGQSGGDDNAFVVPDSVGAVICAGLQQTENTLFSSLSSSETTSNQQQQQQNKHSAAAWTLRYTIEAVVADLKGIDRPNMNMGNNGDWLPSPTAAESMDATCVGRTSPAPGILFDPVVGTNDNENANADNDDNDNDESIPVSYDDDNDDAVEGINVTTTAMNDPSATAVANANVNTNSNNGNVDTVIGVAAAITSTSGASVSSHEHRTRFDLVSLALWTLLLVAVVA